VSSAGRLIRERQEISRLADGKIAQAADDIAALAPYLRVVDETERRRSW
jgi:hypothetical protein